MSAGLIRWCELEWCEVAECVVGDVFLLCDGLGLENENPPARLWWGKQFSDGNKYALCGYTNVTCLYLAEATFKHPITFSFLFVFIDPRSCLTIFKRVPLLGSPVFMLGP